MAHRGGHRGKRYEIQKQVGQLRFIDHLEQRNGIRTEASPRRRVIHRTMRMAGVL